ncbi:hypothetical protein IAU59_005482 [Kwoniella sp. CBS 9459]
MPRTLGTSASSVPEDATIIDDATTNQPSASRELAAYYSEYKVGRYTDADGFIARVSSNLPAGAPSITGEDIWTDDQILRWSCGAVLSHMRDSDQLEIQSAGRKDNLRQLLLTCSHADKDACSSGARQIAVAKLGVKADRDQLLKLLSSVDHAQLTKTLILGGKPLCSKHSTSDDQLLSDISQKGAVGPPAADSRREKFSECGLTVRPNTALSSFHPSYIRQVSDKREDRCGIMLPINRVKSASWPRPSQPDGSGPISPCSFPHVLMGLKREQQKPKSITEQKAKSSSNTSRPPAGLASENASAEIVGPNDAALTGTANDAPSAEPATVINQHDHHVRQTRPPADEPTTTLDMDMGGAASPARARDKFPSHSSLDAYQRFIGNLDQDWYRPCVDMIQSPMGAINRQPNNWFPGTDPESRQHVYTDESTLRDGKKEWLRSQRARKLVTQTHELGAYVPEGEDAEYLKEKYGNAARTRETCSRPTCGSSISRIEALKEEWPWRHTNEQGTERAVYCHWGCQYQPAIDVAMKRAEELVREELWRTEGQPYTAATFSRPDSRASQSHVSSADASYVLSGEGSSGKRRKTGEPFSREDESQSSVRSTMSSGPSRAKGKSKIADSRRRYVIISSSDEE